MEYAQCGRAVAQASKPQRANLPEGGFGHLIKCNAQVARCSRHLRREGQGRRENGRDIIRWCVFADPVAAKGFAKAFNGTTPIR